MTDKEIVDFCKENNVELYSSWDAAINRFIVKIRRGSYVFNTFIERSMFLNSNEVKNYLEGLLRDVVSSLNDLEEGYSNG